MTGEKEAVIRFSHIYVKMPDILEDTWLIGVSRCKKADLPKEFLEFDTKYYIGGNGEMGHYDFGKMSDCIVLMLFSRDNWLDTVWCTIRSWNKEKEDYYRSLIGKRVRIEVEGEREEIGTMEWRRI